MKDPSLILVVDDEEPVRQGLVAVLSAHGFETREASDAEEAFGRVEEDRPDVVLLDLRMPRMDGLVALEVLRKRDRSLPVIVVTAHGDVESAVRAMKAGAYDFIEKPPEIDRLLAAVERALEKRRLESRVRRLETNVEASLEWLFGRSPGIRRVIRQIRQVAWSGLSVVVEGETGVGKSLVARSIHNESPRSAGPFVTVDLGVVPESLVESHLFGHERGAFTGADRRREGVFRRAAGGTLFLDELQNVPLQVQGKLLSAVEERRVFPLGGRRAVEIDVRIIAATNTDIRRAVREKRFRDDLYYRLGEFMIKVPPLRTRREDIGMLAERFLEEAASEMKKPVVDISEPARALLEDYDWPGNVRELKNAIRQAVVLARGESILPSDLNLGGDSSSLASLGTAGAPVRGGDGSMPALRPLKEVAKEAVWGAERSVIQAALRFSRGNRSRAAQILRVDYKTLLRKIREYDIDV